ncbi:hypothetical protein [Arthrobacter sp. H20]|uniref:hypothetical protein n=1 Tax=Arthrobacter sp. H20 TaxID=1267981 RepID=UPI00047AA83C|nr:hypothetical protein [Arthrobacter sp. H20]
MILLAATYKSDRAAYALMFRQLAASAKAIHDVHKATADLNRVRGLSGAVIAASKAVEASAPGQAMKPAKPERMTIEKLRERHPGVDEETLRARLFVERTREGAPIPGTLTRGQKPIEHGAPTSARGPEHDSQRGIER